jgi:glycosyltransferase involved in cell wall biosynthesis
MSPACFEPEPPDVSIIIPTYNRGDVIHYTLESVRRAKGGFHVETIVVDDGSLRPIDEDIKRLGYDREVHVIRQSNQGLLFARLTGIAAATGRHVLFLDSDDLISPQKLTAQLTAMDQGGFDVSYTDTARTTLQGAYNDLVLEPDAPTPSTSEGADFFINIQPAPHSPIFRASFLRDVVHAALFPPSPLYNAVAEIWFYHNAAPRPARVVHVPGAHTIIGSHGDVRLTSQWERLAVGSLGVMEAFARSVPDTAEFARARTLVGEKAFRSWRRLPRDFHEEYDRRLLQLWLNLAPSGCTPLGGTAFRLAGALLGPVAAGRLFRRWQGSDYNSSRTMKDADFFQLLACLPAA